MQKFYSAPIRTGYDRFILSGAIPNRKIHPNTKESEAHTYPRICIVLSDTVRAGGKNQNKRNNPAPMIIMNSDSNVHLLR